MWSHHAQITIPPEGEATARAFHCALLGLPEIANSAALDGRGGFRVQLGDQQLHIGVSAASSARRRRPISAMK